jgi:hypothetical protein
MLEVSPFQTMAQVLGSMHGAEAPTSKSESIRSLLERFGPMTARAISEHSGIASGDVAGLIKHDIARGRVRFNAGLYRLAPNWDEATHQQIRSAAELLRRHGYQVTLQHQ